MTILITGAFGFVGTNLSVYLADKGHAVWALDVGGGSSKVEAVFRKDAKAQRGGGSNAQRLSGECCYARCFSWDELETIPWGEVDAVVHLAGKAHDTRNASDAQSYFDVNVGLTSKVLEAWENGVSCRGTENAEGIRGQCGVVVSRKDAKAQRKFILFSSVKAVADRVEGVLTEEALPDPQTPYGQSKLEAEELLRPLSGKATPGQGGRKDESKNGCQADAGIVRYILRPCMIHGPGNKGNLNLLYGVVRKGLPWPLGAFENRRSFASIGNVCAVVEGLLTGDVEQGVYQVADDEALSTNDLIALMAETLNKPTRIWRVSKGWACGLARVGDVLRLPLNSERLKKLTESYVVSNAKIKAALGWERMPVAARDGMRKTLESFGQLAMGNGQ